MGLLAARPMHGYDLKLGLEELLGSTSPVNVGQIYTAIAKLEKSGFIEASLERTGSSPEKKVYHLTPAGLDELYRWFAHPVERLNLRNELFIKLSLARRTGRFDTAAIIRSQRATYLRGMQELTSLRESRQDEQGGHGGPDGDVGLLIEGAILRIEADLKWLELWEKRCAREGDRQRR